MFPVLSIKALQFTAQQHHATATRACLLRRHRSGIRAVRRSALRSTRHRQLVEWGFQLQSPLFIAYLAYLFLTGLSLSGWLLLAGGLMNVGQGYLSQDASPQARLRTPAHRPEGCGDPF